jgi:hypothetical protein
MSTIHDPVHFPSSTRRGSHRRSRRIDTDTATQVVVVDERGAISAGARAVPSSERGLQINAGRVAAVSSDHPAAEQEGPRRFIGLKRVAMAGITALVAVNIWTGAPLLALWVGSQVVGQRTLSMAALGVVVVVLALLVFVLAAALTWLNNIYDELTERPRAEPRATWLRSMRAEAEDHISQRVGITALERIVMTNVYVAVIALVIWYIFFAGPPSPILALGS